MAVVVPVYARRQSQVSMLLHTVHLLNSCERTPDHIILVDDASPHAVPTNYSQSSRVSSAQCLTTTYPHQLS